MSKPGGSDFGWFTLLLGAGLSGVRIAESVVAFSAFASVAGGIPATTDLVEVWTGVALVIATDGLSLPDEDWRSTTGVECALNTG